MVIGGTIVIVTVLLPDVAIIPAAGLTLGVTCIVAGDDLVPSLYTATTLNVYGVPFAKPVNVIGEEISSTVFSATPAGVALIIYFVCLSVAMGAVIVKIALLLSSVMDSVGGARGVPVFVSDSNNVLFP